MKKEVILFKSLILILLVLTIIPLAFAQSVTFNVKNSETQQPINEAVVVLNGLSDPSYSETQVTDTEGTAIFTDVPDYKLYSFVVYHEDYESYSRAIFTDGIGPITILLEPLDDFTWRDVFVSDENLEGSWYSTDSDIIYTGGERMNHVTVITNIRNSGSIVFDHTTTVLRNTYTSDDKPTEWNSIHTPDKNEKIELKPNGWIRTTFNGNQMEICINRAKIYTPDMTIELFGEEYICQKETRNENIIPYYLDGEYYIETTSKYKVGENHYSLTAKSPNFFINNDLNGENHAPLLNQLQPIIVSEGDLIRIQQIAIDPDNDPLEVSINDSRFEFVGVDGNSYNFEWQTREGDKGHYIFQVQATDGELTSIEIINITILNSFLIYLDQGFNLVSLPLTTVLIDSIENEVVFENLIGEITKEIKEDIEKIYYYNNLYTDGYWQVYEPNNNDNDLLNFDSTRGFWFKMKKPRILKIKGYEEYDQIFTLKKGINMIGYPSETRKSVEDLFSEVKNAINTIYSFNSEIEEWQFYSPELPESMNSLTYLEAGSGYWIIANQDSTWIFNGEKYISTDGIFPQELNENFNFQDLMPPNNNFNNHFANKLNLTKFNSSERREVIRIIEKEIIDTEINFAINNKFNKEFNNEITYYKETKKNEEIKKEKIPVKLEIQDFKKFDENIKQKNKEYVKESYKVNNERNNTEKEKSMLETREDELIVRTFLNENHSLVK